MRPLGCCEWGSWSLPLGVCFFQTHCLVWSFFKIVNQNWQLTVSNTKKWDIPSATVTSPGLWFSFPLSINPKACISLYYLSKNWTASKVYELLRDHLKMSKYAVDSDDMRDILLIMMWRCVHSPSSSSSSFCSGQVWSWWLWTPSRVLSCINVTPQATTAASGPQQLGPNRQRPTATWRRNWRKSLNWPTTGQYR